MIKHHGFVFSPYKDGFEPLFGKGIHNRHNYENISKNGLFPYSSQYEAEEGVIEFTKHQSQKISIPLAYLELFIPKDESEWAFFDGRSGLIVLMEKDSSKGDKYCQFLGPIVKGRLSQYAHLPCADITRTHFKTFDIIDNPALDPYSSVCSIAHTLNHQCGHKLAKIACFKIQFLHAQESS